MKIFFSGIGGAGVSALAAFMADKNHTVRGSDRSFDTDRSHPAYAPLAASGVALVPQDGQGITADLDLVVFSTAVEKDLPEPRRTRELGLRVQTRPEFLADLVRGHRTFAVAGTSGKSTTSGMLAFLLRELGREPNFIGGGRVPQFKSERNVGNALTGTSDLLVVEACESDGSIVSYRPELTLLLNLDLDHHSIEKTAAMFETLAANTARKVIFNADDEHLPGLRLANAVSFGFGAGAAYRAEDVKLEPLAGEFTLRGVRFRLNQPGRYNLANALACLATLAEFGVPLRDCVKPLAAFTGIERRFDVHLNQGGGFVMDDYAHNPHKIASMMQMAQGIRDRITYVFQPHGFAPTRMMKREYIEAFARNLRPGDRLALLPIFYVGGTVAKDISSEDLANGVRQLDRVAEVTSREELLAGARPGEAYIVFGARDESLSAFAAALAARVREGAAAGAPGPGPGRGAGALI